MLARLKRESIDFVSFFLLPLVALLLPWSLAYRFYYRLAGHPWLFRQRVCKAHANASKLLDIHDDHEWCRRHRLILMLDVIDFWIAFLQPWRVKRLVQQHGEWPQDRPLVIVGTHWGPAFMLLANLNQYGIKPMYILRVTPKTHYAGMSVLYRYHHMRSEYMHRLLPGKRYDPGGYPRKLLRDLENKKTLLMLSDVNALSKKHSRLLILNNSRLHLHMGILKPLISKGHKVVTYQLGINWKNGLRHLYITELAGRLSSLEKLESIDDNLITLINTDSTQWSLWHVLNQYL